MEIEAAHTNPTVDVVNTSVPYAAASTMPKYAQLYEFFPIVTPFIASAWKDHFHNYNLSDLFSDIPPGIRFGFDMGIQSSPDYTYVPPNHSSAFAHLPAVLQYIHKELSLKHYTGPFLNLV